MKSIDPQGVASEISISMKRWAQSLHQVVNGNIEMGTPAGNTPSTGYGINNGVYTQFKSANTSGVLIRIAAYGITGTGAPYNWVSASNVGVVINHGLLRQPVGYHVVDMDKQVTVYRTAAPDENQITLAPTDNSASVTVYVF